jgi:IS605 OrfB family transposase
MEELGRVVATFHAQTETNDYIRSFGRPERVREAFDENYAQTQRYVGGPQTAQQYRETQAYTDRFFAERQELFQQRIEQNRIRECHGDHHSRLRAVLQRKASKGTRSSRRRCRELLQRLSGKERRFQAWVNHRISKAIVSRAKATNSALALEDLTGIRTPSRWRDRERVNQQPRSKTERRRANSWAFYQLRQFLEYKALRAGVALILVPPAYTSQTCHRCLHIHPDPAQSYRNGKQFKCGHCGWEGDADLNGANVIALLGAAVNQPRGSWLACQLQGYRKPALYCEAVRVG